MRSIVSSSGRARLSAHIPRAASVQAPSIKGVSHQSTASRRPALALHRRYASVAQTQTIAEWDGNMELPRKGMSAIKADGRPLFDKILIANRWARPVLAGLMGQRRDSLPYHQDGEESRSEDGGSV